jgi:hypothetical protein
MTASPLPARRTSVKTSSSVYRYSAVEIEIAGRLLLEPEPVVVRRVLKEFGRLLEDVVALLALLLLDLAGYVVLGGLLAVIEGLLRGVGLRLLARRRGLGPLPGGRADGSRSGHGALGPGRRALRFVIALQGVVPLRFAVGVVELVLDSLLQATLEVVDGCLIYGHFFWFAAHRTKRVTLGALDLRGVGAAAALQVQVLADRIVQQTHGDKAYSPLNTFAVCADPRRV